MTTTMEFTLSPTLLGELQNQSGVYLYAFAFDSAGGLVSSTTMISGGAVQPTASFSLDLTTSTVPQVKGGNAVVVLQQLPSGQQPLIVGGVSSVTAIGDVVDTSIAQTDNYRYDAIEYTLLNQSTDAGDLTNIVQFGGTMQVSVS